MFANIDVCEFVILKVFTLLKVAILGLPKVKLIKEFSNQDLRDPVIRANDLI